MDRWAMVHEASGFVANVIIWDGNTDNWGPPAGYVMVPDTDPPTAAIGGTWDGTAFHPAPGGVVPDATEEA